MSSPEDFLRLMLEENLQLANQAERMRLSVATGNLCLATALQIGLPFLGLERKALPLTLWMTLLGIYGCFALMKLYERETYHRSRVRKLRAQLNKVHPDAEVERLFQLAEQEQKQVYPLLMRVRLNTIWIALHIFIGVGGVIYSLLCLLH